MFGFLNAYLYQIIFIVVLIELSIALYTDIKTGKVTNKLNLIFLVSNIFIILIAGSSSNLLVGMMSFLIAFALLTPVYLLKILGGGDVKLILAVSPCFILPEELIGFIFMSLLWGGVFGLISNSLNGNLRSLLRNTFMIAKKQTVAENKIPFTFGILLGWLSYKTFLLTGVL